MVRSAPSTHGHLHPSTSSSFWYFTLSKYLDNIDILGSSVSTEPSKGLHSLRDWLSLSAQRLSECQIWEETCRPPSLTQIQRRGNELRERSLTPKLGLLYSTLLHPQTRAPLQHPPPSPNSAPRDLEGLLSPPFFFRDAPFQPWSPHSPAGRSPIPQTN